MPGPFASTRLSQGERPEALHTTLGRLSPQGRYSATACPPLGDPLCRPSIECLLRPLDALLFKFRVAGHVLANECFDDQLPNLALETGCLLPFAIPPDRFQDGFDVADRVGDELQLLHEPPDDLLLDRSSD